MATQAQGRLSGLSVGQYRLQGVIGRGGMGEVYLAADERLRRRVAVKVLPQDRVSDPAARQRLLREARLACKVTHPYVVTVHDILEHQDDLMLVMELAEGQSLSELLRARRPSVEESFRYALEIAEALAAIHGAGLVHRDLKPGNVMITPTGHVKVMDFGVARDVLPAVAASNHDTVTTHEQTLTQVGAVGTLNYMAPEQVRGEPVGPRSDLFSLGVVVYETLTGTHPFLRRTQAETASAILHDPPGRGLDTETLTQSGPLGSIVMQLLDKDPARRPASAEALVLDLRAIAAGGRPRAANAAPWLRAPMWAATSAAVLGVALVALAMRLSDNSAPVSALANRPVVAVLPFVDRTGEKVDEVRGEMLASLLGAALGESKHCRPMSAERLREILEGQSSQETPLGRIKAVQKIADARWILAGTLFHEGDSYVATIDVHEAGVSDPIGSLRVSASRVMGLVDRAAVQLHQKLFDDDGEALASGGSTAPSSSEEALLLEERARRMIRELRYVEAIDLLGRAVSLDPSFVEAQMQLASALYAAGFGRLAREAADAALRGIEAPGGARTERLALQVRAVHAKVNDDAKNELRLRRELAERYPDEPEAVLALASALRQGNRYDEGLIVADRALALDDLDPEAHLARARALSALGRYAEAEGALAAVERLFGEINSAFGMALVLVERGHLSRARSKNTDALAFYEASMKSFDVVGVGARAAVSQKNVADMELLLGRLSAAAVHYGSALATARQMGNYRLIVLALDHWGARLHVQGKFDEAELRIRDALREARTLENERLLVAPLVNLASVLNAMGRPDEARGFAQEALGLARVGERRDIEGSALALLADILFIQGNLEASANAYRDLLQLQKAQERPGNEMIWSLLGLWEVLQAESTLDEAENTADEAERLARTLQNRMLHGYALLARAAARSTLARWAEAETDLEEIALVAGTGDEQLHDLKLRMLMVQAMLEDLRDNRQRAEQLGAQVLEEGDVGISPALRCAARLTVAELALRRGDRGRALRLAGEALAESGAPAVTLTQARIVFARALAAGGDGADASIEARRAFEEAERMGASLLSARAAATLISLSQANQPTDVDRIRERGRAALRRIVGSVAVGDRGALLSRSDLQELLKQFDMPASELAANRSLLGWDHGQPTVVVDFLSAPIDLVRRHLGDRGPESHPA